MYRTNGRLGERRKLRARSDPGVGDCIRHTDWNRGRVCHPPPCPPTLDPIESNSHSRRIWPSGRRERCVYTTPKEAHTNHIAGASGSVARPRGQSARVGCDCTSGQRWSDGVELTVVWYRESVKSLVARRRGLSPRLTQCPTQTDLAIQGKGWGWRWGGGRSRSGCRRVR